MRVAVALALLGSFSDTTTCRAQDTGVICALRDAVGEWSTPSGANAVAVEGGVAFVAMEQGGVAVLDVHTPDTPRLRATIELADSARLVAVDEGVLCVGSTDAVMHFFDVLDPEHPKALSSLDIVHQPLRMSFQEGVVVVVSVRGHAMAIDATDPRRPGIASGFDLSNATDVAMAHPLAALSRNDQSNAAVVLFDITDPYAPIERGQADGLFYVERLAMASDTLYVKDALGLSVFDVRDPGHPDLLGLFPGGEFESTGCDGLAVRDGLLAATLSSSEVLFFDVSDPGDIRQAGGRIAAGRANDFAFSDDLLLVASGPSGLQILPGTPAPRSPAAEILRNSELPHAVAGSRDALYVALHGLGGPIGIVDVSSPNEPRVHGSLGGNYRVESIDAEGAILVAAARQGQSAQLRVFDTSHSLSPEPRGIAELPLMALNAVRIRDQIAYVCSWDTGIAAVDISDQGSPNVVGVWNGSGQIRDLAIDGAVIALADDQGVVLLDVTDPSNPNEIGRFAAEECTRVATKGAIVFALNGRYVEVLDISDPANPKLLDSLNAPRGDDLEVFEDTLYVSQEDQHTYVFDISEARRPVLRTVLSYARGSSVFEHDEWLYCTSAAGSGWLRSINMADCDSCEADFNQDGSTDTRDVVAFLNAWSAGDSAADIDGNGVIDTRDLVAFLNLWNTGC